MLVEIPVALELASDLLDRRGPIFRDDCCVFVSQSGETADTLQALEYARAAGALCVGVTNTVGSAIARGTHCGIHINAGEAALPLAMPAALCALYQPQAAGPAAGPGGGTGSLLASLDQTLPHPLHRLAGAEIGVASTKAYTSQIVVITMAALALSEDSIAKRSLRDEIIDGLGVLPARLRAVLALDGEMRGLAARLAAQQSLLVFGRGYNYATALEAALKVKEVALMHR
jgi:glucosamine--fructose-6-phosphate aminotransferase (isomerizing)